jgi:hypothetical protein
MGTVQASIAYAGTIALAIVMAGVLARGRYRVWWTFAVFVAAVLVTTLMMVVWPQRFFTGTFWERKETALDFMRFAVAIELAYRTFRAFPGALVTARWSLLFVLLVTLAGVFFSGGSHDYWSFMSDVHPRVLSGSIWLFTAIATIVLWYRLPVHPFHKAVLLSYVPYLLVFSVCVNLIGRAGSAGWEGLWAVRYLNQLSYVALTSYWAWAAWRRAEEPIRPPRIRPPGMRHMPEPLSV